MTANDLRATIVARWTSLWFEPSPPIGLAICRVLFFAAFFVYYLRLDYTEVANLPAALCQPIWPFAPLGMIVASPSMLVVFHWIWEGSMLAACVGLATRLSTAAAFALGTLLLAFTENIVRINHSDAIVVFGLAVMACSRCGDALSVDALTARRRATLDAQRCGDYSWPVRTMWLVFVLIYFAAGVTKLMTAGLRWVTSDHLANLLMLGPLLGSPLTTLGQAIGRHPLVSSMLAGTTLLVELSAPLALFNRRARKVLIPAILLMQLSIRVLFGPGFTEFFVCAIFWIPWADLVDYLRFSSPRVRTPAAAPVHV